MRESSAFAFTLRTAVVLAAAALAAAVGPTWLGVSVVLVGAAALVIAYLRARPAQPRIRTAPAHVGPAERRRVLIVAKESLGDERFEGVVANYRNWAEVLVLAPVRVSQLHRWTSDTDGAHADAESRLAHVAERTKAATLVADDEPLQAIEDALRTFGADEIVVDDERVACRVRERFALPVAELRFS